ncbi:MAG: NAD(P)-binding protein, partial [Acidimicrobiales bacterium]
MPTTTKQRGARAPPGVDHEVVVIGAGSGGIGAAIELNRAGIDDYVVLDKWHRLGGCWLANTYPGVAVD